MKANPIAFLRSVALAEAVSYLVLLGIAMPLKYLANMPMAVRIVGSLHGLLFVVFCCALLRAMVVSKLTFVRAATVFVASFVPLIPFWLDRKMRGWESTAKDAEI
jgi:integral membrane protein